MDAAVIVAGEALIDIVVTAEGRTEHMGGSPANVAVGLARLGHPTCLATHIGRDPRGDRLASALDSEGVALVPGSRHATSTPTATAVLGDDGAATYTFTLEWDLDPLLSIPLDAHVHTGSIAATLAPGAHAVQAILQRARVTGTTSYDPNVRPQLMGTPHEARDTIEALTALSDVVKASDEDVKWLYPTMSYEDVLAHWAQLGVLVAIITRGGQGALVHVQGATHKAIAPPVQVVDTVGAGDSFMAGLLSGLLDAELLGDLHARHRLASAGYPQVEAAVTRALRCAAITVGRAGADPPRRDELSGD